MAISRVIEAVSSPCAADVLDNWKASVAAAIAELYQPTETHFRAEEWIMESSGYPGIGAHRNQHHFLLAELESFASRDLSPDNESVAHAVHFLDEWFELHIRIWDAALVRWLNGLDPERQDTEG